MTEFVFKTKKGKRSKNEDYYGHADEKLFLVADGLGGHPAGEVASKLAVEKAIEVYKGAEGEAPESILEKIFREVGAEVAEKAESKGSWQGMGTTMVAALLAEEAIYIASVGDSSAYLFSEGKLSSLIKQDRNAFGMLTQALGRGKVEVNLAGTKYKSGSLLLLCTDGLTDFLHGTIIEKILSEDGGLEKLTDQLVDSALSVDSTDNITVCLMKF